MTRLATQRARHRPQSRKKQPANNKIRGSKLPRFRLLLVWCVLLAGILGLIWNLYQLQIRQGPMLLEKARQQQMVYLRPFIPRRPIIDRAGSVLALDQPVYTLYAHPKLFKESKETMAERLAAILNRSSAELLKQFRARDSGIKVALALPEEIAEQISNLHANGLELIQHYSRLYPQQSLAADVVGYVDVNRRGQAGIEYSQEKLLERPEQTIKLSKTGIGALMPDHAPPGFLQSDGLQLQLTLDSGLQRIAQSSLDQQLQKFGAKRGSVVVMDVRDGSILTMVSEPSYDPNEYYKSDLKLFQNWALSELYEPGSTFKPLNVAIALEAGVIKPNSQFEDSGQIKVGGWTIRNAEGEHHGLLDISQILQYSSNVGMVQVMQKMQPADYYNWLKRLGLGQSVATDLPFVAKSHLPDRKQFITYPIQPATAAFGQGISLTPLQLVQLHGALANGGKIMMPHIVRGLVDSKGNLAWQPSLPAAQQVFSLKTTQTVVEMMEKVVEVGTGTPAQIPGYRIAGKTGTAQEANSHGGGYSSAQIVSFIGIIPVESPRYVVLAVVDEPIGNVFGATVAAPIVKSVMEALVTVEGIPPSQPVAESTPKPTP
ncbi:MAG: penicillin-binding protein 2 [Chroococcidiopsidaceae cyanobacterium CP_BM_ER_R8_30]|nr:penicillin-binding protein 2 [Chroococcidiopsidaceae cyanobacterium CP_BM_ER_R8_30]